jgi:hypothetical protein
VQTEALLSGRFEALCALRLEGLEDSVVYCGPVGGAVYVERCRNCTIYVAARQVSGW